MSLTFDFSSRAALVTGGGTGVGRAIALALAAAGASVCVMDINPDRCDTILAELTATGAPTASFHGDVANRFQASAAIEHTREHFGRVDLLVNAAGVFKGGDSLLLDEWDWRRVMDVNLNGVFFMSQLLGRVMADAGGGVMLNLASSGARPDGVSYVASKAGVLGLTQQLARELAPYHIRCNALLLGAVGEDDMPAGTPAGMLDDAASAALFLLSDGARFITGQTLTVDGGASIGL